MITDILNELKTTPGSIAKRSILTQHQSNALLQKALIYGLDPYKVFNIVKVSSIGSRMIDDIGGEQARWEKFFKACDACANRQFTGNEAINVMRAVFSQATEDEELWMRKILQKKLAIGASSKSVNKVWPGLIKTFSVSLAHKYDRKKLNDEMFIGIEPKLDGIRCLAVVRAGFVQMFARSGKPILNFMDTVGAELETLPDGVYDGEIMGKDFIELMRQAYRKEDIDTSESYFSIFDFLSLQEWDSQISTTHYQGRRAELSQRITYKDFKFLKVVECNVINNTGAHDTIQEKHDEYVSMGYEGIMIKDMLATYKFGRGYGVMKYKAFFDIDAKIERLNEGEGKYTGSLGSVTINLNGTEIQIGSGFSDDLRDSIWAAPDDFIGRMIEVRYQEKTPDGSLRFPTFVCFRNDRD